MLKQQRRAELKKAEASGMRPDEDFVVASIAGGDNSSGFTISNNQRSLEAKLKEARRSGQLNLSNYGLMEGNQDYNIHVFSLLFIY